MASMYAFDCQRERLQGHVAHGKQPRPLINLPTYNKRDAAQRCIPFVKQLLRTCLVSEERIVFHLFVYALAYVSDSRFVGWVVQNLLNQFGNKAHEVLFGSASSDGSRAQANAACLESTARIEGNHVLINSDICGNKSVFGNLTR